MKVLFGSGTAMMMTHHHDDHDDDSSRQITVTTVARSRALGKPQLKATWRDVFPIIFISFARLIECRHDGD